MTQVGVAACPKCGARYGVQESAAGQTLPCPACGTKFVVQPVARAADDFLPPSVDLAAGGPIAPVSRVLDPVVYPHRDIPWALIGIGTGLCLVLGLILFGGWQAFRAIDALVASASVEQGELTSSAATEAATGAAADVADQVAADATAAVQGAGKAIDRIAGAVTDSIEVPKILPDSHERLADERDRLQAEYASIREGSASGTQPQMKLLDLDLKVGDLAIRWYLLATMSAGERERLAARLKAFVGVGLSGKALGERDSAIAREPGVIQLRWTERELSGVIALVLNPPQPAGQLEEKLAEAAGISRKVCRQLYGVRTLADLERVAPQVRDEIARTKEIGAAAAATDPAAFDGKDGTANFRAIQWLGQSGLVKFTGEHVGKRYGRELVARLSASGRDPTMPDPEAQAFTKQLDALLKEYHLAHADVVKALGDRLPKDSPSVAIADGPGFSPPGFGPGFGTPPGFGPSGFGPSGFGPGGFGPTGFGPEGGFGTGGVLDGSNPHPSPAAFSNANLDAEFEAKRQQFAQQHGADGILTVRASGGTEGQFKALEATVMRLVRPRGHSMSRVGERYQLSVVFAGDVERIAAAITTGSVTTDANGRLIVVDFKPAR